MENKKLKILTVGNSFGVDTSQHVADIALSLGFERVKIGVLYIGGCSINKHYANATNDLPAYRYYENTGLGWSEVEGKRISESVMADDWDFISIQHGTADGSRYTLPASYVNLTALVSYIKGIDIDNVPWVPEGVTEREKEIAVQCANLAISCPFAISPIKDRE
jgi:hypothetical protein